MARSFDTTGARFLLQADSAKFRPAGVREQSMTKNGATRNLTHLVLLGFLSWVGCSDVGHHDPAVMQPIGAGTGAGAVSAAGATVPSAGAVAMPAAGSSVPSATAGRMAGAAGMVASTAGTTASGASGSSGAAGTTAAAGASGAAGAGNAGSVAAAGTGGAAGAMPMAGGPAAGAEAMPREDLGKGDGSDVIAIGDSWMSLGFTGIQQSLVSISGQRYRTYGVPGTRLLDGVIPAQYTSAKRANPDIKTVVMTGGGNDILLTGAGNDRATAGPNTRAQIDMVAERLKMIWAEMGTDNVKDIVYIEYSRGGGSEASVNYATDKIKPICDAVTPARCHWIDSDLHIMMQLADGIHPTGAGCDKIATAILALMEEKGMRR